MTKTETNTRKRSGAILAAALFALTAMAAASPGLLGPGAATHALTGETITVDATWTCTDGNTSFGIRIFEGDPITVLFCGGNEDAVLEFTSVTGADSGVAATECSLRKVVDAELGPDGRPLAVNTGLEFQVEPCADIQSYSAGDDGIYQYRVWVGSFANNTHEESFWFAYDNLPPDTPVTIAGCVGEFLAANLTACGAGVTSVGDVISPFAGVPAFGADLDLATAECRYNHVIVACGSGQGAAAHGEYSWTLLGADDLGNFAHRQHKIIVDLELPTLDARADCSIYLSAEGWCRTNVKLDADAFALSGIASLACELRAIGEPYAPVPCDEVVTDDGIYEYRATATSNVGHVSDPEETFFQLDTTAPDAFFVTPKDGASYILGQEISLGGPMVAVGVVPVEFFAADPLVNGVASGIRQVEFRDQGFPIKTFLDGEDDGGYYRFDWDVGQAPAAGTSFQFGERTLEARVHDKAGNWNIVSVTFTVPLPPLLP